MNRKKSVWTDNYNCILENTYILSIMFMAVSTWSDNTALFDGPFSELSHNFESQCVLLIRQAIQFS